MKSETRGQLALLLDLLERDFYHPLQDITFEGFRAEEALSLSKAQEAPRRPMSVGTHWGDAWQYAWLFAQIELPDAAKGERIVMNLNPGGESTLFVDGAPFGTRRAEWVRIPHHYMVDQTLTRCAEGGERFSLALEVYGGTPLPTEPKGRCATGAIFPEEGVRMTLPPPGVIGRSSVGVWNEEAYQLWLDMSMLLDIHETLKDGDYWKEAIDRALCGVLNALDAEQPLKKRREAYRAMRAQLAPYMAAKNGTFAPQISAIANSHLDVAWLWPLEETRRKTARTFAQQLRLLEEYPEARFLQSQAILYEMCREHYPKLFERIREAVKRGQWIVEGAMWVEPDTNLAGGEALIRQILYGKQYFKEHFGVDCQVAWLPDSFGYSAVLPQIMKKSGMLGLTTQKIFWTYNDAEKFPYHSFMWQGMDGSSVDCYLHMQYESFVDPKTLDKRWYDRVAQDGTGEFYLPFGYGDGGGGPTRDDYEQVRREQDLQGVPKMRYEAPADFFLRRKTFTPPTYRGELYFQCHRGTYTSQAAIKRGNRRCEQNIRALELWASVAAAATDYAYPKEAIRELWNAILLNQFHDILPGSAIGRVYEEARALYDKMLDSIAEQSEQALSSLMQPDEACTLMNAQSVPVTKVVQLDARFACGAITDAGETLAYTPNEGGALALVTLPAMGGLTVRPVKSAQDTESVCVTETKDGFTLDNGLVRAKIDRSGRLVSFVDKQTGMERIGAPSNRLCFYRDVPRAFDAWDIDSQIFEREFEPAFETQAQVVLSGGVRGAVRVEHRVLDSVITQVISLDAAQRRLDFDTTVDWHERHKLLKVAFDTGIEAAEASNQIQFGYVTRPTHASRPMDADRFEVCNHAYTALWDVTHGAAVLNDCKYGVSMRGREIGLTLLRGATHPDAAADQGMHRFTYAYFVWDGAFQNSGVVHEAGKLNAPVLTADGALRMPSLFSVDDPNAVIETVKQAEDGSGDLIVRVYESMNGLRTAKLSTCLPLKAAYLCSMLEEREQEIAADNGSVCLKLKPFEIVTLRLCL